MLTNEKHHGYVFNLNKQTNEFEVFHSGNIESYTTFNNETDAAAHCHILNKNNRYEGFDIHVWIVIPTIHSCYYGDDIIGSALGYQNQLGKFIKSVSGKTEHLIKYARYLNGHEYEF